MEVKRRVLDQTTEKQIISAMIWSQEFMRQFAAINRPELYEMPVARLLATWCHTYFLRYEQAPQENILDIASAEYTQMEAEDVAIVSRFMDNLFEEKNDRLNVKYILDKAEKYLNHKKIQDLCNKIKGHLANDNLLEAQALITEYSKIGHDTVDEVDLFGNLDWVNQLFRDEQQEQDRLFSLKGELGEYVHPFYRETLVTFVGAEKSGKSWWLMETAMCAMNAGCNVAFFNLEMRHDKLQNRFAQYIIKRPIKEKDQVADIPVFDCLKNQRNICQLIQRTSTTGLYLVNGVFEAPKHYVPCAECRGKPDFIMSSHKVPQSKTVWSTDKIADFISKKRLFSRDKTIRIKTVPPRTWTIRDIEAKLDQWENEGFVADVVIIDYLDLMVSSSDSKEYRHKIDDLWINGKRVAMKRKVCVVTATQGGSKDNYGRRLGQGDLAEDKRKAGHAERVIAIHNIGDERKHGRVRLSLLFEREHENKVWQEVVVLQALSWGQPYLDSFIMDLTETPSKQKRKAKVEEMDREYQEKEQGD